jgi:hypothetical protein
MRLASNSTMANTPPTISGQHTMFEPLGLFNIGYNLDLVSQDNPEKLEARYGNLLPVIVKAIQEESTEKDKKLIDQAKEIKVLKRDIEFI